MASKSFLLPDVGEGLTEAEIIQWRVAVGDVITVNQVIVEIETAKAAVELPAPFAGTVIEILAREGEVVEVGKPIITVETGDPGSQAQQPRADESPAAPDKPEPVLVGYGVAHGSTTRRARSATPSTQAQEGNGDGNGSAEPTREPEPVASGPVRTKPPVRKFAKDHGIDLRTVPATGPDGIITRDDVARAVTSEGASARVPAARPTQVPGEVIAVRGVQRSMADAMVRSAFTAPHVTEWVEVDVTGTTESVKRLKAATDIKVSPMLFACAALIRAAATFPRINSSWVDGPDGPQIQIHGSINLGIAVASPRGLLVPVIRDAQDKNVVGLGQAISDIVQRARDGVTSPQELSGGTISLTNIGVFGIDAGTPILVPGQAAILAIGQITRKPWVIHDAEGQESLGIRDVMTVSLSFDHRIIDGELGSRVLRSVADYLGDPTTAALINSAPLGLVHG
jgi:pyruvate/2-oxoglutarate dehydrogenase complex dihydrolipoamide acyltransferase (E2) component